MNDEQIAKMVVRLTQYGYNGDPDADKLTREGWGAFGNKLNPGSSCALKRSTAKLIGAVPRCKIVLTTARGDFSMTRFWDDVIPESDLGARCDLYEPAGYVDGLPDFVTIQVVLPDPGSTPALPLQPEGNA